MLSDDVALFIDWENFKISLAARGRQPNVSALKEEVANHGRVVVSKAYADWVSRAPELKGASQFVLDPPSLYAAGIEPVYVPTRLPPGGSFQPGRTMRIKNSVDVKMTADCIDTAHSFPNIKTFVLVSGDSDFIHVINSLRAVGKRVLVVGVSWATSRRMADHVDGLIFYDSDVDPINQPEPNYRNRFAPPPAQLANPGRHQLPEVIRAIEDVIRAERAAGHTLLLTSLKQRLVRRISGFDERKLGYSGFKKLMLRVAEEGNIKIRSVDLVDWILMADEPDPQPEIHDDDDETNDLPDAATAAAIANFNERAVANATNFRGRYRPPAAPVPDTDEPTVADEPHIADEPDIAPVPPPRPPAEPSRVVARTDAALTAAFDALGLPESDSGAGALDRVADLIVMGYTLEQRDGVDSVMFNALCQEVSQALTAGIEADDPTVVAHWGADSSRNFVTRLVRTLAGNGVFEYRNVSVLDAETNRRRRRRVFGLNHAHTLTGAALSARLGAGYAAPSSGEFTPVNDAIATPPLDNHGSAEADGAASADDAEAAALTR